MMLKIAVFVSGGGTNLQSLIDACSDGSVDARIEAAISNNSGAYGLKRASKVGIATYHLSSVVFADKGDYLDALIKVLADHKIDLIVLAGYMKLLPSEVVSEYYGRIINIHPALLPKYGGKGMYGMNVHRAVLKAGDRYSGATVHMVDEKYDHGSILIQRQVRVEPDDSPETLAARVLKIEHEILPRAVSLFVK